MSSGKLRLNLAALRLKSFETTQNPGVAQGTVKGMSCEFCTNCTFTLCGNGSCANYSQCNNASVTDSGCYGTEFCQTEGYGCETEGYGC